MYKNEVANDDDNVEMIGQKRIQVVDVVIDFVFDGGQPTRDQRHSIVSII